MSKRTRQGFTLVELLVVIAIIGILVALLLPAVQQAREAARRNGCLNSARQITLAMLNHESATSRYPLAGSAFDGANLTGNSLGAYALQPGGTNAASGGFSWGVRILPFIEEQALFDAIKTGSGQLKSSAFLPTITIGSSTSSSTAPKHASAARISSFVCASFPGDDAAGAQAYDNFDSAAGNYVAMVGTHLASTTTGDPVAQTGVLRFALSPKDKGSSIAIPDGTSKTIVIGESQEEQFNAWYDAASGWATALPLDQALNPTDSDGDGLVDTGMHPLGVSAQQYGPDPNNPNTATNSYNPNQPGMARDWGPSSAHSGIVIYSFGDNHTRSITNDVDAAILYGLVHASDRSSIAETDF